MVFALLLIYMIIGDSSDDFSVPWFAYVLTVVFLLGEALAELYMIDGSGC